MDSSPDTEIRMCSLEQRVVVLAEGCWALRWDIYGYGWSNSENPELNESGGVSSTSNELPLGVEPDALINE